MHLPFLNVPADHLVSVRDSKEGGWIYDNSLQVSTTMEKDGSYLRLCALLLLNSPSFLAVYRDRLGDLKDSYLWSAVICHGQIILVLAYHA